MLGEALKRENETTRTGDNYRCLGKEWGLYAEIPGPAILKMK